MTDVLRSHRSGAEVPRVGDLDFVVSPPLADPGPSWSGHVVQFYEAAPFLLDELRRYVGPGLCLGDTVVVIATAEHRHGLEARLLAGGLDLDDARARGQYLALDAAETLARFMVDGRPDAELFLATVGRTIEHVTTGGRRVRAFGEMVALLAANGEYEAAIRLEQLWNDLRAMYSFSLLCAYPLEILSGAGRAGALDRVCAEHGRVVPAESYATLTEPDARLRAISRLQQRARSLEAEIAERKKAEQALRAQLRISADLAAENARLYREARDAVRQRDEFLAIAAHELRTPLTAIHAHAQMMLRRLVRDESPEWPAVERAFGAISQQTGKLTRLIEQLLDVSRLDTGRLTLIRQVVDLGELVERVAGAAAVRASQRIDVQAPPGLACWVDSLRLDQLLTNLLDNAIKFGSEDAPIEVTLRTCPAGQVEIAVRDHGAGIPEEKRGQVFERFFQAHAEGYQSGMGLGLYIGRQIVELHGGTIAAEFPPDGGTRFVVRLPAVPEAPAAPSGAVAAG